MIEVRPFETLGRADHGWLKANHHFSFAHYFDPSRMSHGALRVWNDDEIAPGGLETFVAGIADGFAPLLQLLGEAAPGGAPRQRMAETAIRHGRGSVSADGTRARLHSAVRKSFWAPHAV